MASTGETFWYDIRSYRSMLLMFSGLRILSRYSSTRPSLTLPGPGTAAPGGSWRTAGRWRHPASGGGMVDTRGLRTAKILGGHALDFLQLVDVVEVPHVGRGSRGCCRPGPAGSAAPGSPPGGRCSGRLGRLRTSVRPQRRRPDSRRQRPDHRPAAPGQDQHRDSTGPRADRSASCRVTLTAPHRPRRSSARTGACCPGSPPPVEKP